MASPRVATKLHLPRPRSDLVARPRLAARLDRGARAKLTLIAAPTGFGKTSLVTQWLSARTAGQHRTAWLALDRADDQPAAFWEQVVAAIQAAGVDGFGASIQPLLESGQAPSDGLLAGVINELDALEDDLDLVLDDYHVIEDPTIHDAMAFVLDHLPPQVHLVMTTRADPPFPLARLRAQGDLVEVRAADLRFTSEEASTYLNEIMGLGLEPDDIAALEGHTEGWAAALQLAALSMEGREDVAAFVAQFTGNDRYIVDYLVEEVLGRTPDEIRTFLLDTCILERLTGPLCDAVTERSDSKAMLADLERRNLFVVPLDDERQWYRYHHLFADVLQAHLEDEKPERALELHRRASGWYLSEGQWQEAVAHALAARDFDQTAQLVEGALPAIRVARQEAALLGWVNAIPDEIVRRRPVLNVGFAGALLASGEVVGVENRLDEAERQLAQVTGDAPPAGIAFADEAELRRVPGEIEMFRTALAQASGDMTATVDHAQRALALSPEDDYRVRAGASGFLGIVSWTNGDLDAAHRFWGQCVDGLRRAGHVADALGATLALGDICMAQGRLQDALATYRASLELVPEQSRPLVRGTADMHVGMSEVFLERFDLAGANEHLGVAEELGDYAGMPQFPYRWRVVAARLRAAERDLDGALELIDQAERHYVSDFFPNVRPLAAHRARLWIANAQLREALGWARQAGVGVDDDLDYLREFEHITLARLLLGRAKSEDDKALVSEALALLGRLGGAATEGARAASVIEIRVLEALAHRDNGDKAAALDALERALDAAVSEGQAWVFVEEGQAMASLLKDAARRGIAPDYVAELLAAASGPARPSPRKQGLVEPLSERELDVLRLLGSDLSGPEIARELMVSLNTLRTHTKNIYMKLGVNNRRAALSRAQELDLLSRTRDA